MTDAAPGHDRGRFDLLVPGVYAWLHEPSGLGWPNAGVVVDEDGITVIDTLAVPSHYQPFGDAVTELGLPIKRVVLTSSHIEFVGGTDRFRLGAVYGTAQASAHLDQPANPEVYRLLLPDLAAEFDDEMATRPVSHVVDSPVQLTPAVALLPMSGQMAENLVALVAGAGVVFAGAMCSFGVTPLCFQGDPGKWADELDRLVELAPIIVPGHGPVGGEEEAVQLQGYLRACVAVAAAGDIDAPLPPGPWDEWPGRDLDAINVERAAMIARGDDGIPQRLLARLGRL